jgi:acyl-lipid omega-6 desaturase (Delta-12 desaturase)
MSHSEAQPNPSKRAALYRAVTEFQDPSIPRSLRQIANSALPYFALVLAMYWSLGVSYWLTLALAVPASGFLVRVFIIFHDCGHGSFFRSRVANRSVGFFAGLLFFLPYHYWTHQHSVHHATAGDLDNRGSGDVNTITVREYKSLSPFRRFVYRAYRNPFTLLVVGPLFVFFIRYRYWRSSDDSRRRNSAMLTNLSLLAIIAIAWLTIGIKTYVMIQLPIMVIAGTSGVWLFYVQHQFKDTYWETHERWNHLLGALEGSSFYKLPRVLQWFSGNIGFHHVHHLSPRIPNYRLQACHEAIAELRNVKPIHFWESFRTLQCHLWDEERRRLVAFAEVRV